jgi:hypothetical protein
MDVRHYFILGSKLIGLYSLVLALLYFVELIPSFVGNSLYSAEDAAYFRTVRLFLVLAPILLTIVGLYLIRGGVFIHRMAFPENGPVSSVGPMEGLFTLGIKLYGVFLIANSIPYLLKLIANYILVASGHWRVADAAADVVGIETDFIPYLVRILLGLYFLLRGETITRLAFWKQRKALT